MESNHALAEAEIKSVLVRERYYRDSCQWDKLRNSYHPEPSKTSIKISWYKGDIDGFVLGSRNMASRGVPAIHILIPVEIDIQDSKAFAVSVGSISARFVKDGADYDLVSNCRFLSRLEKIEASGQPTWKMLTMDVIYIYDSITPAFPRAGTSTLAIEDMKSTTRKSYRYLSWLLAEQGHVVSDDMPGVDDEQSVKNIMEESHAWLHN